MAEVTNELLLGVLNNIQNPLASLEEGQGDVKNELVAIRQHQHASQGEINAIYGRLGSMETRLDRIEKRLDIISEPAE